MLGSVAKLGILRFELMEICSVLRQHLVVSWGIAIFVAHLALTQVACNRFTCTLHHHLEKIKMYANTSVQQLFFFFFSLSAFSGSTLEIY